MDWHCFINYASLPSLALRTHVFLCNIQALNNDFADLWHCPRNHPLLPSILSCDDQDGITLLDIHFGKVQRFLLFLFCCHLLPLYSSFVFVVPVRAQQTSTKGHVNQVPITLRVLAK